MNTSARYLISLSVSTFVLALALSWTPQVANSQQTGPTDKKGIKTTAKQAVYLGPEIAGMEGQQLRMQVIAIEPGGYNVLHNPKNRPAVVYLLQGTDTVILGDVFQAEETAFAPPNAAHWDGED